MGEDRILAMKHSTHPDIVKRLKRADGHLRSILAMMEEGRDCLELAQQLHAVEAAIAKAKRTLIEDHIEHCLGDADAKSTKAALMEFKALSKYF